MGSDFGSFDQSPLGAFVQSALGVRGFESDATLISGIFVVTSSNELYAFAPEDMSTFFGPLPLLTADSNCIGLDIDDDGERFFINWNGTELACFASDGSETWRVDPGVNGIFGHGIGFDGAYVFNSFRSTTTNTNDTISIQARNATTGDVVLTKEVYQDTVTPYLTDSVGLVTRQNAAGVWQVFILVYESNAASRESTTLYSFNVGGGAALTLEASQVIDDDIATGFDDSHTYLSRSPENVLSAFFDVSGSSFPSYDAYEPDDLADDDAADYTTTNAGMFYPVAFSHDEPNDPESPSTFYAFDNDVATGFSFIRKFPSSPAVESEALSASTLFIQSKDFTKSAAITITEVADHGTIISPYSQQMTSTGTVTYWALQALPSGSPSATISASGLVEWATPVKAGSPHDFRVYAAGASGWDIEEWLLYVQDTAPTIDAIGNDGVVNGQPYFKNPTLSAGDAPVTWSLDVSPSGANINTSTGAITWTAGSPGTVNWTVRASNLIGDDTESWSTLVL